MMPETSEGRERIAKLEAVTSQHERELHSESGVIIEIRDEIKQLTDVVSRIETEVTGMKGFVAGIAFAFSLLGGIIAVFFGDVMRRLGY